MLQKAIKRSLKTDPYSVRLLKFKKPGIAVIRQNFRGFVGQSLDFTVGNFTLDPVMLNRP